MPTITAIAPSAKHAGRALVLVDGRAVATLGVEAVARLGLAAGADYEPLRAAVEDEAAALALLDDALGALARSARSRAELRRRLLARDPSEARVDAVLARVAALGALDDAAYARQVARSRAAVKGASKRKVQAELARRGVARDVADAAVREVFRDEAVDETANVVRAAERKLRALAGLDPLTRRRRLYGYLARQGFDADAVRAAVKQVLGATPDEDE